MERDERERENKGDGGKRRKNKMGLFPKRKRLRYLEKKKGSERRVGKKKRKATEKRRGKRRKKKKVNQRVARENRNFQKK